jgi:hypothetical protein
VNGELEVMFDELNVNIDVVEIEKAIDELHNDSSGGNDLLLNEFKMSAKDILKPHLHKLFNAIFNIGIFPSVWSEGRVVPLHKQGNVHNTDNYKGITLLSVLGKLLTNILNNRLMTWAESYQVYVDTQAGFRKGLGTVDNVYALSGLISYFINSVL